MTNANYKKSRRAWNMNVRSVMLIGCLTAFLMIPRSYAQTAVDKSTSCNKNNTKTMEVKDYTTSILVDQSPQEVFNAINNVRGWWQGEITGSTDKLNDEFTYRAGDIHYSKQKIVDLIPNKRVEWLVTESKLNFVPHKDEWTSTKIIFDISKEGDKTKLTFTHHGLVPTFECYDGCSGAWEKLVEKSLFSLITTGKGMNVLF
ncbi:SRPBCC domain-containing protein [Chitinophaga sp.]|uniref:SRPBCC family protein n=1 Tax=Chitinophaga sp. TaxID=1869181 RepID=UPI0025C507E4|nr:SRPBCC domain-containing protein [Chitinophaga sp.]